MPGKCSPRYKARYGAGAQDLRAAQALRFQCFRGPGDGLDRDDFDALCRHVLIEEEATGQLVACFRLLPLTSGRAIRQSYAAQYYELSALEEFSDPMIEIGRFCIHPDAKAPADILRLAWGVVTRDVDAEGAGMLFGCSSFAGTDATLYRDTFALLGERHLAPKRWLPRVKAPKVVRFAGWLRKKPDPKRAQSGLPPLLRSYLMLGGWVSDHAVVDEDLGTLHVFTGVEIAAVPPARARLLRADAAQMA